MILLDVDGVIADFVGAVCRDVGPAAMRDGRDLTPARVTQWDLFDLMHPTVAEAQKARCRLSGWGIGIRAYPGAISAVKANLHRVTFVTAPFSGSPTWAFDRENWLEQRFGRDIRVIHTSQKGQVCGDTLVDDNICNIVQWETMQEKEARLLRRPWNHLWWNRPGAIDHVREAF